MKYNLLALGLMFVRSVFAIELCEYASYTPEGFYFSLQRSLPSAGIVLLQEPPTSPTFKAGPIPLVRGQAIVGYIEFKKDVVKDTSSLLVTDVRQERLFSVREVRYPFEEIIIETLYSKSSEKYAAFRIMNTAGLHFFYRDRSVTLPSFRGELDEEIGWLHRVFRETDLVTTLPPEKTPEQRLYFGFLTEPALNPYARFLTLEYRAGVMQIAGRVSYAIHHLIVSKALELGFVRLDTRNLIIDTEAVVPPPVSYRVAEACHF